MPARTKAVPTRAMSSVLGRSYRDAPEIDGYVLVEGELPVGEIVPCAYHRRDDLRFDRDGGCCGAAGNRSGPGLRRWHD